MEMIGLEIGLFTLIFKDPKIIKNNHLNLSEIVGLLN